MRSQQTILMYFCFVFSSSNVPSWIWLHGPTSSLPWASPELGTTPSERVRSSTSTSRSVPPSLSLRPSSLFSLSVRLCQRTRHISSVSSRAESLWITPPKPKEGCWCLIGRTSKPLRINNPPPCPAPPADPVHSRFIFSHVKDLSGNCLTCAGVLSSVQMPRRVWVTPQSGRLGGWGGGVIWSWDFPELSVVVLQMTNTDSLASARPTTSGAGASVPKYVQRATPAWLSMPLFFFFFFPQATPRQPRQLALRITIPAIHTTSTCPW